MLNHLKADRIKRIVENKCKIDLFPCYSSYLNAVFPPHFASQLPPYLISHLQDLHSRSVSNSIEKQVHDALNRNALTVIVDENKTNEIKETLDKYRRAGKTVGTVYLNSLDSYSMPYSAFLSQYVEEVTEDVIDFWNAMPYSTNKKPLVIFVDGIEKYLRMKKN
jgi:hypothetical protein